jgi:hypothetical protein
LLNLSLRLDVVRVEMTRDADLGRGESEVLSQEIDEETRHLGIGIRKHDLIPFLRALCPKQHATSDEVRIAKASPSAPVFLVAISLSSASSGLLRPTTELTVVRRVLIEQRLMLLVSQLNVSYPKAH